MAAVFVSHGLVGGTFSAIQGGGFGSGFLSAGVAELAAPYVNHSNAVAGTLKEAVIGGTTSVIGGGKFENGVITGAFGYLFNQVAHPPGLPTNCGTSGSSNTNFNLAIDTKIGSYKIDAPIIRDVLIINNVGNT